MKNVRGIFRRGIKGLWRLLKWEKLRWSSKPHGGAVCVFRFVFDTKLFYIKATEGSSGASGNKWAPSRSWPWSWGASFDPICVLKSHFFLSDSPQCSSVASPTSTGSQHLTDSHNKVLALTREAPCLRPGVHLRTPSRPGPLDAPWHEARCLLVAAHIHSHQRYWFMKTSILFLRRELTCCLCVCSPFGSAVLAVLAPPRAGGDAEGVSFPENQLDGQSWCCYSFIIVKKTNEITGNINTLVCVCFCSRWKYQNVSRYIQTNSVIFILH